MMRFGFSEYVSLGHPDKIADYISEYILDRYIDRDPNVRYALEVQIKDNHVTLGGEITSSVRFSEYVIDDFVRAAVREIGYTPEYQRRWGRDNALSCDDEYAGLDIKTQVTVEDGAVRNVIVAVPMLPMHSDQDIANVVSYCCRNIPGNYDLIVNGTGRFVRHASMGDCGTTGRKLAVDFYGGNCNIGGGSPWTKDASKADVTLNFYARKLALEYLQDNDECFVYLSSCIGRSELPSTIVKTVKHGVATEHSLQINKKPSEIITELGLNKPVFARLCKNGL